jgi:hypothetical protein
VQNMGLYLATPCFSHGQLYVALSRVTARDRFKALIERPELEEDDGAYKPRKYVDDIIHKYAICVAYTSGRIDLNRCRHSTEVAI